MVRMKAGPGGERVLSFRVYAVFGPPIVDIHKLQEVPKMTIDWFGRWGAERRLAWGHWKMVCCVGGLGAVGKASAKQARAAVRNSQIRLNQERATASFFLPCRASQTMDRQAGAACVAMFSNSATVDRAGMDVVSVGVRGAWRPGNQGIQESDLVVGDPRRRLSALSGCEAEKSFLHTPTGE